MKVRQEGSSTVPPEAVISEVIHEGRNALQEIQAGLALLRTLLADRPDARAILDKVAEPDVRLRRLFDKLAEHVAPEKGERESAPAARVPGTED